MSIKVICGTCNATLNAPDTAAGKKLKCPKCQNIVTVPFQADELTPDSQMMAAPPPLPSARKPMRNDDLPTPDIDDQDDRPARRQRGPRRDAHETQVGTGLQMGLGGTATGLGAVALIFSFVPCCGMPFALGFGGLGLVCGGIGVIVALVAEKRGLVFPCVGTGISALAMLIAVAWFLFATMATTAGNQAAANVQKAAKAFEEQNKKMIEEQRKLQEEAMKKQKDGGNPPGPLERTTTERNLTELGKAFLAYNDSKNFPMSSVKGQGKLSWRVEILPYIQQQGLYAQFKLDEAWNSPHNRKVLDTTSMPLIFVPARTKPGEDNNKTYLRLFTGPGTCYPSKDSKPRVDTMSAGTSNTWLMAEGKTAVEWTKPDELEVKGGKMPALGGVYGSGFYLMCADGKPHYVGRDQFSPQAMMQLINPMRPEVVNGWPPN